MKYDGEDDDNHANDDADITPVPVLAPFGVAVVVLSLLLL